MAFKRPLEMQGFGFYVPSIFSSKCESIHSASFWMWWKGEWAQI